MRLFFAMVGAAMLFRFEAAGSAQSPQAVPGDRHFEVASVKPMLSPFDQGRMSANGGAVELSRIGISTQPGGRFTAGTVTLKQLIANAFDVRDYQIEGGPPWLTSDYFEVTANAGADASPDDVRSMLRTLLAERFGLRTHTDTRQAPLHVLMLARADGRLGSGLKRTTPECIQQIEDRKAGKSTGQAFNSNNRPTAPVCGAVFTMVNANGAQMVMMGGMELTSLVRQISTQLAAPVVDRTGLTGLFDITLEFMSARRIGGRAPGLDPNSTEPMPVPIEAAIQPQLGLKLEKETGPLPIVVIDAAAHPTPD